MPLNYHIVKGQGCVCLFCSVCSFLEGQSLSFSIKYAVQHNHRMLLLLLQPESIVRCKPNLMCTLCSRLYNLSSRVEFQKAGLIRARPGVFRVSHPCQNTAKYFGMCGVLRFVLGRIRIRPAHLLGLLSAAPHFLLSFVFLTVISNTDNLR